MTTLTAPAFTVRHRTLAGPADSPITELKEDTYVRTTATVTSARFHGTGLNRRATIGLRNDDGATLVATIDADHLAHIPAFFLAPAGYRVHVAGLVQRIKGCPITLAVSGIAAA